MTKQNLVRFLGTINAKQFEIEYNKMSRDPNTKPIASTILPFLTIEGGTSTANEEGKDKVPYVFAWIFYEQTEEVPKQKLKLEM